MELPPKSILENTLEIADFCECAELEIGGVGGGSNNNNSRRFILLTEMACLIHLRDFINVRHLWRRYSHLFTTSNNNMSEILSQCNDPEFYQFSLLWNVAKSMISNNFGEVYRKFDDIISFSETGKSSQIMEPLITYAKELRCSYREFMLETVTNHYEIILDNTCRLRLGFTNHPNMDQYLFDRGWEKMPSSSSSLPDKSETYWMPRKEFSSNHSYSIEADDVEDHKKKIRTLTDLAIFMEKKRMTA